MRSIRTVGFRRRDVPVACLCACWLLSLPASTALTSAAEPSGVQSGSLLTSELLDQAEAHPDETLEDAARQQAVLRDPTAVAERERSRSRYGGIPQSAIDDLVVDQFGDQLVHASLDGSTLDQDARVVRRVGLFGEAIVSPEGQHRFITSDTPLSTADGSGGLVPVDLSLEHGIGGWRPTDAATGVVLPDQLSQGIRLTHAGVTLRLADSSAAVKIAGSDTVLYPDAVTGDDADFLATPTVAGLETFIQVRSPAADESSHIHLTLPGDSILRANAETGGADVVRQGDIVASVFPPSAMDSDGQQVSVSMSVDGDSLVLSYPHRGKDLAYPLLVDPNIRDTSLDAKTWSPQWTDSSFSLTRDANNTMFINRTAGGPTTRTFGQWVYNLPHNGTVRPSPLPPEQTTARVAKMQITAESAFAFGDSAQNPMLINGILNTATGQWAQSWSFSAAGSGFSTGSGPQLTVSDPLSSANDGAKAAIFALDHPAPGTRTQRSYAYFFGADIEITDPEGVSLDPIANPAGYRSALFTVPVHAKDPGLGVYSYTLFRTGSGADVTVDNYSPQVGQAGYCDGRPSNVCPQDVNTTFGVNPQNSALSEGVNHLKLCGYDLVVNVPKTCALFDVKVDRSAPRSPASSSFRASFNADAGSSEVSWEGVDDPPLSDGTAGSGGVNYTVQTRVNGGGWSAVPSTAPVVDVPTTSPNDTIDLKVSAKDAAGNSSAVVDATVAAGHTAPADGSAPAVSLTDADAVYSANESKTLIEWAPGVDPDLSDGSASAGVKSYNVRYRLGSSWVAASVDLPRLIVSGGHAGDPLDLEVTPIDASNNPGMLQAKSLTIASYTASVPIDCAPTDDGLPAACNDTADNEPDNGGRTTLAQDTSQRSSPGASATGLARYRLNVDGIWTTARLRHGSFVVGNVRDGWTLDRVGDPINGYYFGTIRGAYQGCGWVQAALLGGGPYASNGTSNCDNQGSVLPALSSIASEVNPLRTDGSPVELKRNQSNGVRFCAYLNPSVDNVQRQHDCSSASKVVTYDQLKDGYRLKWRYVVRGGNWVLVRDETHHSAGYGTVNWWFVRRSALGRLCKRYTSPFVPAEQACAAP